MLTTGLAVFFLLGGIVAGIIMKQTSKSRKAGLPIILGVIAAVVTLAGSCFVSVPTGHTGVVTTFGKVENFTLDAGIHGKLPFQEVVLLDNRVQKANVMGCQFHPEKSGTVGLNILRAFCELETGSC